MVHIRSANTTDYMIRFKRTQNPSTTDVWILNITFNTFTTLSFYDQLKYNLDTITTFSVFPHIRTVQHLDIIKVLFTHQLMH